MRTPGLLPAFLLLLLGLSLSANVYLWQSRSPALAPSPLPAVNQSPRTLPASDLAPAPTLPPRPPNRAAERLRDELRRDAAACLRRIQSDYEGSQRIELIEEALREWAGIDPEAAARWVEAAPADYRREAALYALIGAWAGHDPAAAAAWLSRLPADRLAQTAMLALAEAWAQKDPAAAATWCLSLPEEDARIAATASALTSLASRDSALALARFQTVDPDSQPALIPALALGLARHDPESALLWAQGLALPRDSSNALTAILNHYAETSPSKAASALLRLPETHNPDQHVGSLMRQWALSDYPAAQTWSQGLPAGSLKDAALRELGGNIAQISPSAALADLSGMADPIERDSALAEVFGDWLGEAPDQARAWLRDAKLAPESQQALSELLDE